MANLEETPSSQLLAFWRETSGAAETRFVPTATAAKARDDALIGRPPTADFIAEELARFSSADAIA